MPAFATPEELARVLKIRDPTEEQTEALNWCLESAALEIITEIDFADLETVQEEENYGLEDWQLSLASRVNLERAIEWWKGSEAAFGILGIGVDLVAVRTPTDPWTRHALKLQPLKEQWGLA